MGKVRWLVTATAYGEITEQQAEDMGMSIFPCGHCSGPNDQVFHNLMGRHNHWKPWVKVDAQ